ncbi:MAG: N-acetyltransferase [Spirochaetes bacterium]|nr:N-acetyltransferase [Spirochaetota bacterium]
MNKLSFVEAQENDLSIILDIYNYYIINSTANYYVDTISIDTLKTHLYINHDKYKTFLIYYSNGFAGFCYLTQFRKKHAYSRTGEIGIYLNPDFTNKKFGEQIITHLESAAKDCQLKVLIASISNENLPSRKLIQKMGYIECAHYKDVAEKFGRLLSVMDYQKFI